MPPTPVTDLKTFIPTKDAELSKVCHSEAQFYRARNLLLPANSRFLTAKRHRFGMKKCNCTTTTHPKILTTGFAVT
jgi:hypothetical protein